MAGAQHAHRLREEATCSICLEYFNDPVSIDCGHNFCRPCITLHWGGQDVAPKCPQCRVACPLRSLRPNWELRSIVEVIKLNITPSQGPEAGGVPEAGLCPRHQQRLQLFCETDQKPICVVCDKSREHRGHAVIPVEEAAQEYKVTLESCLAQLLEELEELHQWTAGESRTASDLERNFKSQTGKVVTTFELLNKFLEKEKKHLLTQLEKEHDLNIKTIEEKVYELEKQKSIHRALIAELERTILKQDVELLQNMQSILKRCEDVKAEKPEEALKVVQTLSSIEHAYLQDKLMELKDTFPAKLDTVITEFWTQLKNFQCVVTLDPDTANRYLILSEGGRSVRLGDRAQDLPDTPERYNSGCCVLGRERLSSGRHYWEVEVGDKTRWFLGVCDESVSRKGSITESPEIGYWAVQLTDGQYCACTSPFTLLAPCVPPSVLGFFLDYGASRFSVYNVTDGSLLFTFSGAPFPRTLRPYFCTGHSDGGKNLRGLRVLPVTG